MEALFLALMLPKIGGAFTLKDNLVMKRFSVKELRQWIMETATEAIQGDSSKWRRTCSGNLSDLKLVTPDMTKYIEGKTQYYGLNLYPYNCVVYW